MYPTATARHYIKGIVPTRALPMLYDDIEKYITELDGLGTEIEKLEFIPVSIVQRLIDLNYVYDNLVKILSRKELETKIAQTKIVQTK